MRKKIQLEVWKKDPDCGTQTSPMQFNKRVNKGEKVSSYLEELRFYCGQSKYYRMVNIENQGEPKIIWDHLAPEYRSMPYIWKQVFPPCSN